MQIGFNHFQIFFQAPGEARALLKFFDEDLGEPIPEKDYGGGCLLYDPDVPEDPYHNLWDKMDVFVFSHLFGYFCKTLIFRDWWLTTVISGKSQCALDIFNLDQKFHRLSCFWGFDTYN